MTFDPHKVDKTRGENLMRIFNSGNLNLQQRDWVDASDYDKLLASLTESQSQVAKLEEQIRVQKMDKCAEHRWEDTGGELCMWPPIRVYECMVCGAIGNVKGRQRGHGSHDVTFNMSEITFSNKVCEPHYKSTTESI